MHPSIFPLLLFNPGLVCVLYLVARSSSHFASELQCKLQLGSSCHTPGLPGLLGRPMQHGAQHGHGHGRTGPMPRRSGPTECARLDLARRFVCLAAHWISTSVCQSASQLVGQSEGPAAGQLDRWTIGQTAKHLVAHETFEKHTQQAAWQASRQDLDTLCLGTCRAAEREGLPEGAGVEDSNNCNNNWPHVVGQGTRRDDPPPLTGDH